MISHGLPPACLPHPTPRPPPVWLPPGWAWALLLSLYISGQESRGQRVPGGSFPVGQRVRERGKKKEAAFSVPETYLGLVDIKRYP